MRLPVWWPWALLAIVGGLTAGVLLYVTSTTFFYADDYVNLGQARDLGMSWDLLRTQYFQHFAPGHRVLDWAVVRTGADWTLARGMLLAFYVVGVVAFVGVARELTTTRPLVVVAVVLFITSPVWVRTVQWFASGAHVIPSLALTTAALWCALVWIRRPGWWLLALFALVWAAALAFYVKALLLPVYIVLIRYGVFAGHIRTWPGLLRRDAPLLIVCAVVGLGALWAVRTFGSAVQKPVDIGIWLEFGREVWLRGATPLLLNQWGVPEPNSRPDIVAAIAQAVLVALVVLSVWLRPRAWRAWVFWVAALGLNTLAVGSGRLADFGVGVAYDLRYEAEVALLLPLTLLLAFSEQTGPLRPGAERAFARPRVRRTAAVVTALAVAALLASAWNSATRVRDGWAGKSAGVYVDNVRDGLDAFAARGTTPRVLDAQASFGLGPILIKPYERLSQNLRFLDDRARVEQGDGPLAIIGEQGEVLPLQGVRQVARVPVRPGCRGWVRRQATLPAGAPEQVVMLAARGTAAGDAPIEVSVDAGQGYLPETTRLVAVDGDRPVTAGIGRGPVTSVYFPPPSMGAPCLAELQILVGTPGDGAP